jgi:predicted permease
VDLRVLAFTAGLAVTTCIVFGLAPAIRATRLAPSEAMRGGSRGATAGRERFSLRRSLVVTQVALSLVLLVGSLLFVRSLHNLLTTDAGFQAEGVLAVRLDLRQPQYSKERLPVVYRDLLERLSTRPGVTSAAQVGFTPISDSGWNNQIGPDGAPAEGSGKESFFNRAGPGYFHTMDTPLLAGREFDERDTLASPKVAIVNEEFTRRFFGGADPVGRTFRMSAPAGEPEPQFQIVGLVKNTKYYELREDFIPIAFFPVAQDDDPGAGATFVLRIAGPVGSAVRSVTTAVAEVSPAIGVEFRFLSQQLHESLLRERLMATLSAGFGLLAGLLATLGLYGVIAYMVARRRNEIGVRMALGADRSRVIRLVLREATLLLAAGLTFGALIALWAGRAAATLLFDLQPHDPVTITAAMGLLAAAALAASYGPARRAAALEPMKALREE